MLKLSNEETNKCLPRVARGFTLIELLLVMVLMAIIIGISAPAFVGLGRGAGMRGAVRSVHSTLSLLRQWAITHREQVTFCYFKEGPNSSFPDSYFYATNEFGSAIISTDYNDADSGSPRLPLDVMFAADGEVTFKTDGGLTDLTPDPIIIVDRKRPDVTKTITINSLTGGITVE
jgi:prepilin-type N-terminal cleavage/methylation domain-containing protein